MLRRKPSRVCTVSTVKDSPANLVDFVRRNQAAGADHMFLFVDDADPEVLQALAPLPGVTAVGTGADYWRGDRPARLNQRQNINANLVNVVLSVVASPVWLFHLDSDECLDIDKAALRRLRGVDVVKLSTLECLSKRHWDGPPDRFKRQLAKPELRQLVRLGVISRPRQHSYFRSHLRKPGMRPRLDRRLRIHFVATPDGERVPPFEAEWLRVLHLESPSGEEFIRKWMTQLDSGGAHYRPERAALQAAVAAVVGDPGLGEDDKRERLLRLYDEHVRDDEEVLDRLGFLVTPRAEWHRHSPDPLPRDDTTVADWLIDRAPAADKSYFKVGGKQQPPALWLARLREELGPRDTLVRKRLDRVL